MASTIDPKTGLPITNQPISTSALSTPQTPLTITPPADTTPILTSAMNTGGSYTQQAQESTLLDQQAAQAQQDRVAGAGTVADLTRMAGGRLQERANLAQTNGENDLLKQISGYNTQAQGLIREATAIPLQTGAAYQGSSGTQAGVASVNRDLLQRNALQSLTLAQSAAIAQGNYDVAKNLADQQVNAKYAQIDAEIAARKINEEALYKNVTDPAIKKALEARMALTKKEEQMQAEKKETEKSIQDIGMTLRKYGADDRVVNEVLSSTNINDAIRKAGTNLQDPKAKLELEGLRLDHINKKIQAQKTNYEMQLLQKYGGMSPSEYRKELKEEQKQIQEATEASEKSRLQGLALDKKITLLGSVLNSDAIDSVVGSSFASRGATGFGGFVGRLAAGAVAGGTAGAVAGLPFAGVGAIPGALIGGVIGGGSMALQGSKDYFTGSADKLVGQTEQFISKEFIDSLISAKSAGATFGALTKPEQEALTAAASFIGQRRIYEGKGEDKIVVGYDMSEQDFKRELETIKTLTEKAYETSTGKTYDSDEKLFLDKAFDGSLNNNTSSPEEYY